ncbi:unnamed protein product, partial [Prorocentrum cordatum]
EAVRPPETGFMWFMDWFTLIFWTINMPASLMVAFSEEGLLVVEPHRIAKRYFRTWFALDLVVVIHDWVFTFAREFSSDGNSSAQQSVTLLRALRLVRLVRLLRLLKLRRMFATVNDLINSEYVSIIVSIVKMMGILLVINHLLCCMWYALADNMSKDETTWVEAHGFEGASWEYLSSALRASPPGQRGRMKGSVVRYWWTSCPPGGAVPYSHVLPPPPPAGRSGEARAMAEAIQASLRPLLDKISSKVENINLTHTTMDLKIHATNSRMDAINHRLGRTDTAVVDLTVDNPVSERTMGRRTSAARNALITENKDTLGDQPTKETLISAAPSDWGAGIVSDPAKDGQVTRIYEGSKRGGAAAETPRKSPEQALERAAETFKRRPLSTEGEEEDRYQLDHAVQTGQPSTNHEWERPRASDPAGFTCLGMPGFFDNRNGALDASDQDQDTHWKNGQAVPRNVLSRNLATKFNEIGVDAELTDIHAVAGKFDEALSTRALGTPRGRWEPLDESFSELSMLLHASLPSRLCCDGAALRASVGAQRMAPPTDGAEGESDIHGGQLAEQIESIGVEQEGMEAQPGLTDEETLLLVQSVRAGLVAEVPVAEPPADQKGELQELRGARISAVEEVWVKNGRRAVVARLYGTDSRAAYAAGSTSPRTSWPVAPRAARIESVGQEGGEHRARGAKQTRGGREEPRLREAASAIAMLRGLRQALMATASHLFQDALRGPSAGPAVLHSVRLGLPAMGHAGRGQAPALAALFPLASRSGAAWALAAELSIRIQKYLEHMWQAMQESKPVKDVRLIQLLSEQLNSELKYELALHQLRIHPLFSELCEISSVTVHRLANHALSHKLLCEGDTLFHAGEVATHMYIVVKGRCGGNNNFGRIATTTPCITSPSSGTLA